MSNAKELIAEAKVVYLDHTKDWGAPPHDCPCPACLAHDLAVELEKLLPAAEYVHFTVAHRAMKAEQEVEALRKRVQELEEKVAGYEESGDYLE